MGASVTPALRALAAGVIGTALATGVHFLTLSSGAARVYLASGQGLPHTPGLPTSWGGLAMECLVAALPVLPAVALTAFAGRVIMSLGFLVAWFWGANRLGLIFAAESGGTFGWGDGFTVFYNAGAFTLIATFTALCVLWILAPRPR